MTDTTHVKGLAELQRFLTELPAKMEQNIMRGAMRQGMNVIRDEAKRNVPVKSGQLRDGLKVSTSARRGVVIAKVKVSGKHAHIGKWLEYGTAAHIIRPKEAKELFFGGIFTKAAQHPGMAPRPYLRPALDGKAQAAVVVVAEYVKARLNKQGLDTSQVDIGPK